MEVAVADDIAVQELLECSSRPLGKVCAGNPQTLGAKARAAWKASPTARPFLERLNKASGPVTIVGEDVHVVYPECYCQQTRETPAGEVSSAYCAWSVGWVKELFRHAMDREARVTAMTTIVRGGTECRLRVDLGMSLDEPSR